MKNIYLVFDIGKTNKKALYYSIDLKLVDKRSCQIDVIKDNGLETENIVQIKTWLKEEIKLASQQHHIDGIAIGCHGGTFALLDNKDQLAQPVLSYTSEVDSENQSSFFDTYGSIEELQNVTSSPDLGFVNIGKQIHYVKTNTPSIWDNSKSFLFYPQFLGFLLTHKKSMEVTILGNHSYMWDYQNDEYSSFTTESGLLSKISNKIQKPFEHLGNLHSELKDELNLTYDIPVTVGIHDSNASILPYLLKEKNEFTLLSTGTWCVGLKPNQPYHLSDEDLQTKTFYNLDAFGKPLRTSISPIGFEYEEYLKLIQEQDPNTLIDPVQLVTNDIVVIPGIIESTSIFAESQPGVYAKGEWFSFQKIKEQPDLLKSFNSDDFFMALNASMAIQTAELLNRLNTGDDECVYFEGGFAKNTTYLSCLKSLKPTLKFKKSNLEEATAYGAALTIAMASNQTTEKELQEMIQFESEEINYQSTTSMELYSKHYFNILGAQYASATGSN